MEMTNRKYISEDYFEGTELPIAQAIYADDTSELKRLLKQKAIDINKPGKEGHTFLLYAIKMQRYKMTEILLENGADPNVISPRTFLPEAGKQSKPINATCIESVCYSKYNIKYLKLLVKYRVNVNENRDKSPLFRSIMSREEDKIDFLLRNGADVNIVAEMGTTPLITAADLCWFDLVEQLLDLGADPFLKDKNGSLQKSIQYYINRTKGTPDGRRKVRKLIKRMEALGMTFDFSNAKIKMTDE
jgi:ankyrin repeat protein